MKKACIEAVEETDGLQIILNNEQGCQTFLDTGDQNVHIH